jgi:hypothetical protein
MDHGDLSKRRKVVDGNEGTPPNKIQEISAQVDDSHSEKLETITSSSLFVEDSEGAQIARSTAIDSPCKYFIAGYCTAGVSCWVSHDIDRQKSSGSVQIPCAFFARGTCKEGERCRFKHGLSRIHTDIGESRTTIPPLNKEAPVCKYAQFSLIV